MEGAARETGIPVVTSSRYRPNSAALSLVPRATRTTRRGRCFSTRRLSFSTLRNSVERVRSSASGCCRISSSIRDIDFKIAGVAGKRAYGGDALHGNSNAGQADCERMTSLPLRAAQFVLEPCFGELPVPPDGSRRTLQYFGGLLLAHAPEIAQLNHLGLARRDSGEGSERVIQRQNEGVGLG